MKIRISIHTLLSNFKGLLLICSITLTGLFLLCIVDGCNNKKSITPATPEFGKMTDRDGNVYLTVKIGGQEWMAENLKVKHFSSNGDSLIYRTESDSSLWRTDTTAA